MWELVEDLRAMGESNAVIGRYDLSQAPPRIMLRLRSYTLGDLLFIEILWPLRHPFIKVISHHCTRSRWFADLECPALHGNEDGTIPATFQVVFMVSYLNFPLMHRAELLLFQIGWKPAPTQPRPLERGSAETNLKDVL